MENGFQDKVQIRVCFVNFSHWVWWCGLVTKSCPALVVSWTVACQAPLSIGFSRQEYWSGLPFPSPGESSWPRNRTPVSCIAGRFFTNWAMREASPPLSVGEIMAICEFQLRMILCSVFLSNFRFLFKPVIWVCLNWLTRDSYSYLLLSSHPVVCDSVTPWTAAHQTNPVLHYLLEFAQTHAHWIGDAIQPSHPLLPLSPALNLSQQ